MNKDSHILPTLLESHTPSKKNAAAAVTVEKNCVTIGSINRFDWIERIRQT